ncbi:MAG: hypothetical protein GY833_22760 [Aestuariibacter sp.]|nr:hypothetical protein [Aestuariibacter sp.]|tara:strand:- start:217088 stop:217429 length:342 start_codon:yes stop_codon:yes gene_type:complete
MKLNDTIYAVTDQHVVLTLVVAKTDSMIEDLDGWTKVTTELATENAGHHAKSHHSAYFTEFFIEPDGTPNRTGIYKTKANAVKATSEAIRKELDNLDNRRAVLLAKQAKLAEV